MVASNVSLNLYTEHNRCYFFNGRGDDVVAPELVSDDVSVDLGADSDELYPGGELLLFYGSQTGSGEVFAKQIEQDAGDKGFSAKVIDLGDFCEGDDFREFVQEKSSELEGVNGDKPIKAVFFMSTYGEGDPPDSAAAFCELIRSKEKNGETDYLSGIDFCVFGLGSTEYEHYCACAKLTDNKLGKIGGNRVIDLVLGDDNQDIEGDFMAYKDEIFWPVMKSKYNDAGDEAKETDSLPTSKSVKLPYVVEFVNSDVPNVDRRRGFPTETVMNSTRPYFEAVDCPVINSKELRTNDESGSTLHIDIDISKHLDLTYQTADNLAVLPTNDHAIVKQVATALNLDLDDRFVLSPVSGKEAEFKHPFPTPCTVGECLSRYCDLVAAPRRGELKLYAIYASDPEEKQDLLRISSSADTYREEIMEKHIGLLDLLQLYPSMKIPFDHFLNACPRLQPRYYTISSSSSVSPSTISATVSVLKEKKRNGSLFKGVCSNHLAGVEKNGMCRVFVRPSTFRLPQDSRKPIIMIGPGTGIAPMRALLQERSYQKNVLGKSVGKNVLYFGCKKKDKDYLYSEELEAFEKEGLLTDLHLAFSRERKQKVYVQYLLAKNKMATHDLIVNKGAHVYVCGATKMGNDVRMALSAILATEGNMGPDGAIAYINQLQAEGRYVQELWSS